MADLSREIQRADALVTPAERERSQVLGQIDHARSEAQLDLPRPPGGQYGASNFMVQMLVGTKAVMDLSNQIAATPGLREEARKEIDKLSETLRARETVPGWARRDPASLGTSAVEMAPTGVLAQAALHQAQRWDDRPASKVDQTAAMVLTREFDVRHYEMLRGERSSSEFEYGPGSAAESKRLAEQVRQEARGREDAGKAKPADLSRDIQRADALVTSDERARSGILRGLEQQRNEAVGKGAHVQSGALSKVHVQLAVMDYANRVASTPGLKEEALKEVSALATQLQGRELPRGPVRDPTGAHASTSTPVLIQATLIQGERASAAASRIETSEKASPKEVKDATLERWAAERLANELEGRRNDMLRGARRSDEFRAEPNAQTVDHANLLVARVRAAVQADYARVEPHEARDKSGAVIVVASARDPGRNGFVVTAKPSAAMDHERD